MTYFLVLGTGQPYSSITGIIIRLTYSCYYHTSYFIFYSYLKHHTVFSTTIIAQHTLFSATIYSTITYFVVLISQPNSSHTGIMRQTHIFLLLLSHNIPYFPVISNTIPYFLLLITPP